MVRRDRIAGHPVTVSRTGYTGDLGYEVWVAREHALAVWDALCDAGAAFGLLPVVNALTTDRHLGVTLGFLLICLAIVGWIFRTGYRLKN